MNAPLRALVWDSHNTSSVLAARALVRQGWIVDWIGSRNAPWVASRWFNGNRTFIASEADPGLERLFHQHPLDALFLHGDDQVRWMLARWTRLPANVQRHLPGAEALATALSKQGSMDLARELGIPVLETVSCASRAEAATAAERLGGREVVLKGEGSAAGSAVCSLVTGRSPSDGAWRTLTRFGPTVLVQRRIRGPRFLVTVVYGHGVEHAACVHEKTVAYPYAFGPAAFGITQRNELLHDYAHRLFTALRWHGIADVEFRQDSEDKRWYFMEINPRVCATLGIEERAGMDAAGTWARICAGHDAENSPGRAYRDGVRYAWSVRALALAVRRPWNVPRWGFSCLRSEACDLDALDATQQSRAVRLALWTARHF